MEDKIKMNSENIWKVQCEGYKKQIETLEKELEYARGFMDAINKMHELVSYIHDIDMH